MSKALWPVASGAIAKSFAVDVTANNLANVNTYGFKKDIPTFKEYLSVQENPQGIAEIPHGPIKDKDFYPIDGKDQSFVVVNGTHTHLKQGNLKITQNPLDIALDGTGLLEVSTPQGIRYARYGGLKIQKEGLLVTSEGYPVLSAGSAADENATPEQLAGRYIELRDLNGPLQIAADGSIYSGQNLKAKLSIVEFTDPKKLQKFGSTLFINKDPVVNVRKEVVQTQVHQGMLETSNVNPVEELSQLIKMNRLFEQDLKAMKTVSEMLGKEANDIGKM